MPQAFMEFLNAIVTESATNTYTEVELQCPCSANENLAMLIHSINLRCDDPTPADATIVRTQCHLADRTETDIIDVEDDGCLDHVQVAYQAGDVQGTLSEYTFHQLIGRDSVKTFSPPHLYAKSKMWLAVKGTNNTAGLRRAIVRVGYTLEKVSKDAFIAALVS